MRASMQHPRHAPVHACVTPTQVLALDRPAAPGLPSQNAILTTVHHDLSHLFSSALTAMRICLSNSVIHPLTASGR